MHMEGGALAPSRLEHAASAAAQSRSHAQAKAQGVADKTHARFSPSAANRRIHSLGGRAKASEEFEPVDDDEDFLS